MGYNYIGNRQILRAVTANKVIVEYEISGTFYSNDRNLSPKITMGELQLNITPSLDWIPLGTLKYEEWMPITFIPNVEVRGRLILQSLREKMNENEAQKWASSKLRYEDWELLLYEIEETGTEVES